jgi:hypothetical protein
MAIGPLFIVLAVAVGLLLHRRADRARLIAFVRSIAPFRRSERQIVLSAAARIVDLPTRSDPVIWPSVRWLVKFSSCRARRR